MEDNDVRRYLCATLPFFMSEIMSASPGFLLEGAAKREENNQTCLVSQPHSFSVGNTADYLTVSH